MNTNAMNAAALTRQLEALQRLLAETEAAARALGLSLAAARAATDPFARHIFQARHEYCRLSETSRSKSGKDIERYIHSSYLAATQLGFQGGPADWHAILRAHVPAAG